MASLDLTMGLALVGVIAAAVLYGVTLVQVYYYFTHQKDGWSLVLLVGSVFLFETVHQILIIHTIYHYLIHGFTNPVLMGNLVWSLLVEVLFNGLTALFVQSFFTVRIWKLSNRNIGLTGITTLLVLSEFGCVVAYTALSLQLETFLDLGKLKALSITVNALAAAADIVIAASLCVILYHSRTGFHKSDTMIKKLMVYAVNTGTVTSLCAVASLVSILAAEQTFWYIAFFFCIGRLYSNSLLATLNGRRKIRKEVEHWQTSDNTSFSLRNFSKAGPVNVSGKVRDYLPLSAANISIKVNTTKEFNQERRHIKEKEEDIAIKHIHQDKVTELV